jgi:hypothetical protein
MKTYVLLIILSIFSSQTLLRHSPKLNKVIKVDPEYFNEFRFLQRTPPTTNQVNIHPHKL